MSVVCLAVNWVGGLRDDTVWLFEVTLTVHLYWCHHLHHYFYFYFPVATPNTGSLDQMEGGGHVERDQCGFPIVCL